MNDNYENDRNPEFKDKNDENNEVFASDIAEAKDNNRDNPEENEVFASDIAYDKENQSNQDANIKKTDGTTNQSADGYGQSQSSMGGYYPYNPYTQPNAPDSNVTGPSESTGNSGYAPYTGGQTPGYNAGQGTAGGYGPYYGGQSQSDAGQNNAYNPYSQQNQSDSSSPYGGNVQYQWNYDDYQKALNNQGKPPKKKNKGLKAFVIAVCSVFSIAVVSLAGFGIYSMINNGSFNATGNSSSSSVTNGTNSKGEPLKTNDKPTSSSTSSVASGSQMTAEQVYNSVKNSVVTVEVYDSTKSVNPVSEGSGIISSKDGYIITNEHVIDGAASVDVVLADNKQYPAVVVGKDKKTDLAVLKISASGLTPATFGNSDQISVAETVLAVGNPGGLEFSGSVTRGIVSAVNRTITTESGSSATVIQTDAPINPGNSGGALVNMYGQVIGITSSKIESTGYEGMGFAIPINTAKPIIDSLIQNGYVTGRVKIGISVVEYDAARAAQFGYPAGLLVQSIDSSSDAATKGLKAGDFITKIDGTAITSYSQFYSIESKHKAGENVTLTIFRSSTNSSFDVSIKLAEDKG